MLSWRRGQLFQSDWPELLDVVSLSGSRLPSHRHLPEASILVTPPVTSGLDPVLKTDAFWWPERR